MFSVLGFSCRSLLTVRHGWAFAAIIFLSRKWLEVSDPRHQPKMNHLLATAIIVALFLGKCIISQKFALKRNPDGTYLLVPAGPNDSGAALLDIKSLPPLPVDGSGKPEAPGVNSLSILASPAASPAASPGPAPASSTPASGKTAPTTKVKGFSVKSGSRELARVFFTRFVVDDRLVWRWVQSHHWEYFRLNPCCTLV